jgi:hypothetical protein
VTYAYDKSEGEIADAKHADEKLERERIAKNGPPVDWKGNPLVVNDEDDDHEGCDLPVADITPERAL